MTEKLYYWAENLENYSADNESAYNQVIEIKRLNFFIGKNNAGKSRFLRNLFSSCESISTVPYLKIDTNIIENITNKKNNISIIHIIITIFNILEFFPIMILFKKKKKIILRKIQ